MDGLVDSGASLTLVDKSIVKDQLRLKPSRRKLDLFGVHGSKPVSLVKLDFALPAIGKGLGEFWVALVSLNDFPFDCFIGRDILSKLIFTYNGPSDEFDISG